LQVYTHICIVILLFRPAEQNPMSECNVLTLSEELTNNSCQLIDVRERSEFVVGRVATAKLLPLGEIEKCYNELDREKPVYVMCRSGKRSAQAQKKLNLSGFNNVVNVVGGFEAWKKAGLPFEKSVKTSWSLDRQVRFISGLLVLTGVLLSIFVHPYFIGLTLFVGAGLTFAGATDWCGMAILLAKMPWNRAVLH
jgi:rhodanese-related sulfurtransferase